MLSKAKYPMLNRATRRHPKRFLSGEKLDRGWGLNWLLAGLFIRAGISKSVTPDGSQV